MSSASDFVIENGILKKYVGPGGDVVVPDGVTEIGERAFEDRSDLTSVSLPGSMTTINEWAFCGCHGLTEITFPEKMASIGEGTFFGCFRLTSVTLPESVTSIGNRAFWGCDHLISFVSPIRLDGAQLPASSTFVLIVTREKPKYFAYASRRDSDSLSDYAKEGAWFRYDLELINNGPAYKFSMPNRLMGALGRLLDPVEMTEESRALLAGMLNKNAKKLVLMAEELHRPEIISDLLSLGILDNKTDKALHKLLANSAVPEIAALAQT